MKRKCPRPYTQEITVSNLLRVYGHRLNFEMKIKYGKKHTKKDITQHKLRNDYTSFDTTQSVNVAFVYTKFVQSILYKVPQDKRINEQSFNTAQTKK
jgi:hypothetical protein